MTIQSLETADFSSPAATASVAGVALHNVTKHYGGVTAVEAISLTVDAGSYCCLLGPSGCGKTTTLRMIAGHEMASSGEIWIGDRQVNHLPPAKRNTAMVFQNYALFPHKTVWENVGFGLRMQKVPKAQRQERIAAMLALVGLSDFGQRKPAQLSGGQQQRVALARALATRPQVVLLDEPLSALDESLRVKTRGELRQLQKQFGLTFIQVTHAQDEAFALADQIVVMDHGRVAQVGSPEEIFQHPASQFVAQFVGDNNIFSGRILSVEPDTQSSNSSDRHCVTLEVEGIGILKAHSRSVPSSQPGLALVGQVAQVGQRGACCIRADQLRIELSGSLGENRVQARIQTIEFTGYVTRVTLVVESTGQELLYKMRTEDWLTCDYSTAQSIGLAWAAHDCVFLPY